MAFLFSRTFPFVNFGRGLYEEQFCEIIMNWGQWLRKRCLKISYPELWWPACVVERNHFMQF